MPHELPAVVCGFLQGCSEISLEALAQAARTAPVRCQVENKGASFQAAHKDLLRVDFEVPEGLIAGLGYVITRPGHGFHFQQAGSAAADQG